MDTQTYLAWSLAAAGLLTLAAIAIGRSKLLGRAESPGSGLISSILAVAYMCLMGAIAMKYGASWFMHRQPPQWTHNLGDFIFLLLGLQWVLTPSGQTSVVPQRPWGIFMILLGLVMIFTDFYLFTQRT